MKFQNIQIIKPVKGGFLKVFIGFAITFYWVCVISCSGASPLDDPARKGANLPEVLYSDNYKDNLTYSFLKYRESQELAQADKPDIERIRNSLLQAASYVRIAIKQAEFDVSPEDHEYYQDLLLKIAGYCQDEELRYSFLNRLVKEYELFAHEDRTDVNLHYLNARALFLTGNFDNELQAVKVCTNAISRLDEKHYKTWFLLATILFKFEDYDNALLYYQQAFELRTQAGDTSALKRIARVYSALNNQPKAVEYLENYLEFTPLQYLTIEDYEDLANLYIQLKEFEEADFVLTSKVPAQIVAKSKCKHYKLIGIIELEIINKLNAENSQLNDIELNREKVLMIKSAKFAFEQYLLFYPEDQTALNLLDGLKSKYRLN